MTNFEPYQKPVAPWPSGYVNKFFLSEQPRSVPPIRGIKYINHTEG